MILYLMRAARTPWDAERRVQGKLDIPLGPEAAAEVREGLAGSGPIEVREVFSSTTLHAFQTAQLVARELGARVKKAEGLEEVDLGLWQGLFESDLKRKHRRAYATWKASPLAVIPPRGERLRDAYWRLSDGMDSILASRGKNPSMAVVVPKLAHRLIECRLRGSEPEEFWEEDGAGFRVDRFQV